MFLFFIFLLRWFRAIKSQARTYTFPRTQTGSRSKQCTDENEFNSRQDSFPLRSEIKVEAEKFNSFNERTEIY